MFTFLSRRIARSNSSEGGTPAAPCDSSGADAEGVRRSLADKCDEVQKLRAELSQAKTEVEKQPFITSEVMADLSHIHDQHGQMLYRPLPSSARQVAFMHLPKCCGTSISKYFRERLQPCRIGNTIEFLKMVDAEWVHSLDFVHGHFSIDVQAKLRKDRFLFTIVRDPVERIMSHYFYIRIGDSSGMCPYFVNACCNWSLQEVAESNDPRVLRWMRNIMTRQLTGRFDDCDNTPDEQLAQEAIANLDRFDYVGLYDDLKNSLRALHFLLNLQQEGSLDRTMDTVGRRPNRSELPEDLVSRILELNRADQLLYEHCRARHSEVMNRLLPLIERRERTFQILSEPGIS